MNKNVVVYCGVSLVLLAGIGGFALYICKHRNKIEDEAPSTENSHEEDIHEEEAHRVVSNDDEKGDSIIDYATKHFGENFFDYSRIVEADISFSDSFSDPPVKLVGSEHPYVIDPVEFGELYDYRTITLKYFNNGILLDDTDCPMEDPDIFIGDALDHFGEYEDDAVHVRNDQFRCDYEVIKIDKDWGQ